MALVRRTRPSIAEAVKEPVKPVRKAAVRSATDVNVRVATNAGNATVPPDRWPEVRKSVEEARRNLAELEATRSYMTEAEVAKLREEEPDAPIPRMHRDLEPSTLYLAYLDVPTGFVTFAGPGNKFALAWDICGACNRHAVRCSCRSGSVPPKFMRAMVREMSDEGWPYSKDKYAGFAIGWDHDPDNPGASLPMFFESPAHPWKGRPGTKAPLVRKRPSAAVSGAVKVPSPAPAEPKQPTAGVGSRLVRRRTK